MKRTFLKNVLRQVEKESEDHERLVHQSDILGQPNWREIRALTSLEPDSLLKRYASMRRDKRASHSLSNIDLDTGGGVPCM